MKRKTRPPRAADGVPAPRLSRAERAELHRQGAKAAARGEASRANPLDQPHNQPPATGESADRWQQRREAWDAGHEDQAAAGQDTTPPATPADEHD